MINKIGLLSYPRTGSNWLAYILNNAFELTFIGNHGRLTLEEENKLIPGTYIAKFHGDNPSHYNQQIDELILLLRNPKECILRQTRSKDINRILRLLDVDCPGRYDYMQILQFFDNFKQHKLVLYYEDLLTDIEKELSKLAIFLGYDDEVFESFLENIEDHKTESKNALIRGPSSNDQLLFHSKELTKDARLKIDNKLTTKYPDLTSKYLTRYLEQ